MKKDANSILGVLISTAVLGVAIGYGVTFWQHWRANQYVQSSESSPSKSANSNSGERTGFESAGIEDARDNSVIGETTI